MGKGKRIKSSKDVKQRHNVRKVTKDEFEIIERVWAEDGVVKTETKDGKVVNMSVREAAIRGAQIGAMPLPDWHKKRRNDLVEQIANACREAQRQMEDPKDERAKAISNLWKGLAPDGRTPEQIMKDMPNEAREETSYANFA